jgi:hypothetical protein
MPTLELPEEAYEYISKKLATAMTWTIQVSTEKTSLLLVALVWRKEGKKKKKTDKDRSGATTDCKKGKKRTQGASSLHILPPTTTTPGPDLEKKTQRKSSSTRRHDKRRRAAWITEMKISVEEKTEASPVADLEVDEMDAAPPERTPPASDTETEEEMEITAPRCPSPVPNSSPRQAVGTTKYKKIRPPTPTKDEILDCMGLQDSPPSQAARRRVVTAARMTPAKVKAPNPHNVIPPYNGPSQGHSTATNGPFQGHSTAVATTKFATRTAPPTQDELRLLGLQDEFSSDEYQEEQPPPTERSNHTKTRDNIYHLHMNCDTPAEHGGYKGYLYAYTRDGDTEHAMTALCHHIKDNEYNISLDPDKTIEFDPDDSLVTDESETHFKPALQGYEEANKHF